MARTGRRLRFTTALIVLTAGVATFVSPVGALPAAGPARIPARIPARVPARQTAQDIAPGLSASATRPAVRMGVPPSVATGEPPVPINQSTCRSDLPTPVMTIVIRDISYVCPVYSGRQEMLDMGAVTSITDSGDGGLLADRPGDPGTLWIAAHRSTYRGAFAAVPDLSIGAVVTVTAEGVTASYRIVAKSLVHTRNDLALDATGRPSESATLEAIARTDRGGNGAPRLLLQTCDGTTRMWMIYGDLVTA